MTTSDFDREWERLAEEVLSGMKEWRLQHPRATLNEMEEALDEHLNRMRARMLEDMALASAAANLSEAKARPCCPHCGTPLSARGRGDGGCKPMVEKRLFWNGVMEYVPGVRRGFFPLDEELALLPGGLTPWLEEELTHLATWMPFEKAREMLERMRGVEVSEATVRRHTERNGAAYVALQEAEVERIEEELPAAPAGADKQLLSVDGAMVPLVGGEWAEVKTLVVGCLTSRWSWVGNGRCMRGS